jgi:hypothetical protein
MGTPQKKRMELLCQAKGEISLAVWVRLETVDLGEVGMTPAEVSDVTGTRSASACWLVRGSRESQ